MRGLRLNVAGLVFACSAGACQLVAGIEDLHLTGAAGDASADDGSGDGPAGADTADAPMTDSPGGSDVVGKDGAGDARIDAPTDAPVDVAKDSPQPVEAGEAGITYAQEVLSDNPLAYWRFEEKSGTTAVDSSGNGQDGTYVGNVMLGAPGAIVGDPGTSVTFDGATTYMDAGDVFQFAGAVPCSFEAWVNPVTDASYHNVLSRSDGQGSGTKGYLMYIEPDATPALMDFAHYSGTGMTDIAESNTAIATGTFTHLVGVYDTTMVYIYANGVLLNSVPTTFATPATLSHFVVGAQSGGATSWFNGQIDEVAVYGTPLSQNRIMEHYRVGMGLGP